MRTFLGYRGVVDHQHSIAATDEPIRLDKQFRLHWRRVPYPGGNEVVQLITCAERKSLRHRLNALAIARTDQARHVERTHPSPRLVTQTIHKRLEPTSKRVSPIQCPASHGRPLQESRPPMSHRKSDLGILRRSKSAKVVLTNIPISGQGVRVVIPGRERERAGAASRHAAICANVDELI